MGTLQDLSPKKAPKNKTLQTRKRLQGICFPPNDPGGARTHDLLIKSQLLYQLSYRIAGILTLTRQRIHV